jgi:hypothetical protein
MDYIKRYAIAKHHAWAGSVLLAILSAIRIIFETSNQEINDVIFIILGLILILYILVALIYTYNYRSGLIEQKKPLSIQKQHNQEKLEKKIKKEQLKIEKKKAKSQEKKQKKNQ